MIKYPLCFHHTSSGDKTQSMFGTARCCHAARLLCLPYQSIAQSRARCWAAPVLLAPCVWMCMCELACAHSTLCKHQKSQSSCSGCATVDFQGKWRKGRKGFPNWNACWWRKMTFEGSVGRRGIMLVRFFQRQGKKVSLIFNPEFHVQDRVGRGEVYSGMYLM